VEVCNDIGAAIDGAQIVVGAMPPAYARKVYALAKPHWQRENRSQCDKGLEPVTHARRAK
jgi:glycerol-3-phosphate dehydrogenase